MMKRHLPIPVALVLGAALCACTGAISGDPSPAANGGGGPMGSGAAPGGSTPGAGNSGVLPGAGTGSGSGGGPAVACDGLTSRRLRRLAQREYVNVVSDLLAGNVDAAAVATEVTTALPFEPRLDGFDNQDSALFVSPAFQEALAGVAERLAARVDAAKLAPCANTAGSVACIETFSRSFAERAYGRPPSADELSRIAAVAATGENYASSIRLVVEVVLQSPNLLYVSELGAPDAVVTPGQAVPLTPFEVASQLSFLLTGSRPDAALLETARTKGFPTPADVRLAAERLLDEDSAIDELARFVSGWLDMAPVADAPKSEEAFPELTPAIVAAMQQEFDAFVRTQLVEGGAVSTFLTAQSKNVPAALAPIYGADWSASAGLNAERRRGILSLPGLLAYHASDHHSGPVERGLFVRRQLLCTPVPPPPPEVAARIAAEQPIGTEKNKTTRQKFEAHVNEASCKGCHLQFDPIGYGLEQMDGIGRFRTTENGLPVDSTGELLGTDVDGKFEGVAELSAKLAESKMFETCVVSHFFRFAEARPPEASDQCIVNDWAAQFSSGGGRLRDLVLAYVSDRTFALRKDDR